MSIETIEDRPTTLSNGALVLQYVEHHPGGNGYRRHGAAICFWQGNYQPFVTWDLYRDERGEWHAESGHYFSDIVEAAEDFATRR